MSIDTEDHCKYVLNIYVIGHSELPRFVMNSPMCSFFFYTLSFPFYSFYYPRGTTPDGGGLSETGDGQKW